MRLLSMLVSVWVLGSCNSVDFPAAPNIEPVLQAYEKPTAVVGSQIMSAVADEIAEAAKAIEDSQIFEEILQVIIDIQKELDDAAVTTCDGGAMNGSACNADEDCLEGTCVANGDIVLDGVTLSSPTGVIRIHYICPGWDERQFEPGYEADPDPADGTIDLTMTLDTAGIGRVVWGTAATCRYLVPGPNESMQASYDGGVAVDLGDTVPTGEDIARLRVTFVMDGNIGLGGGDFRINQSFRVVLADSDGLELLVDIGDPALTETFNYIFQGSGQILQDAIGAFGCSLQESRCFDESGTRFSW